MSEQNQELANLTEDSETQKFFLQRKNIDFPQFKSKRILFERFAESDLPEVYRYASNPIVTEFVSWSPHQSPSDTFQFLQSIENCLDMTPNKVFLTWALHLSSSPRQTIGAVHFSQFSEIAGQIDYVLSEEYWNQGFATEAVQNLIAWIFLHYPKIRRIQAHCVDHHLASRRVMEKSGMQFEGIRREGIKMKDKIHDLAIYSILKEEAFTQ